MKTERIWLERVFVWNHPDRLIASDESRRMNNFGVYILAEAIRCKKARLTFVRMTCDMEEFLETVDGIECFAATIDAPSPTDNTRENATRAVLALIESTKAKWASILSKALPTYVCANRKCGDGSPVKAKARRYATTVVPPDGWTAPPFVVGEHWMRSAPMCPDCSPRRNAIVEEEIYLSK
jgi:hypothetical protein